MQVISFSSQENLTKNLREDDFKYLSPVQLRIELELELLKQKGMYPYEYLNISKDLMRQNCVIFLYLTNRWEY